MALELQESPRFEVHRTKMLAGDRGSRWSIKKTAELSKVASRDPLVRAWTVQKIHNARLAGLPTETDEDKARIILSAVQNEFTYVSDPMFSEMMVAPKWMIQGIIPGGDCDDLVGLTVACFLAALSSAGVRCAVIGHSYAKSLDIEHVLCAIFLGKKWLYADPCSKLPLGRTAAPHTWELVYDPMFPEQPFCDATSCLVGSNAVPPPTFRGSHGDFIGVSGLPSPPDVMVIDPLEETTVATEMWLEEDTEMPHLKSPQSLLREISEESSPPVEPEEIHAHLARPVLEEMTVTNGWSGHKMGGLFQALPFQVPTMLDWPLDMPPVAPQPTMLDAPPFPPGVKHGKELVTVPYPYVGVPRPIPADFEYPGLANSVCECKEGCSCEKCGGPDHRLVATPTQGQRACMGAASSIGPFNPKLGLQPPLAVLFERPVLIMDESTEEQADPAWADQVITLKDSFTRSLQAMNLAYENLADTCKRVGEPFPPNIQGQFGPSEQQIIARAYEFANAALAVMDDVLGSKRELVFTDFEGQPMLAFKALATDAFKYVAGKALSSIGLEMFLPVKVSQEASQESYVSRADNFVGTGILPVLLPLVSGGAVAMTIAMIKDTQGTLDLMRSVVEQVTRFLMYREIRKMTEAGASPEEIRKTLGDVYKGEIELKDKEIERQKVDNQRLSEENKNLQTTINKLMVVGGVALVGALGFWAWKNFGGYVPARPPGYTPPAPPPHYQEPEPSDDMVETVNTPTMVSPIMR